MTKILNAFFKNEDGLVTVEWVALASAMVIGAIAIGWLVMGQMEAPANTIGTKITTSQSNTL